MSRQDRAKTAFFVLGTRPDITAGHSSASRQAVIHTSHGSRSGARRTRATGVEEPDISGKQCNRPTKACEMNNRILQIWGTTGRVAAHFDRANACRQTVGNWEYSPPCRGSVHAVSEERTRTLTRFARLSSFPIPVDCATPFAGGTGSSVRHHEHREDQHAAQSYRSIPNKMGVAAAGTVESRPVHSGRLWSDRNRECQR